MHGNINTESFSYLMTCEYWKQQVVTMALFLPPFPWDFQHSRCHRAEQLRGKSPCTEFTEACTVTESVSLWLLNQVKEKEVYRIQRRRFAKTFFEVHGGHAVTVTTPLLHLREPASRGLRASLLEWPAVGGTPWSCWLQTAVLRSWSRGMDWREGCRVRKGLPS